MARLPGSEALPTPSGRTRQVSAPRDYMSGAVSGLGQAITGASNELYAAFKEEKDRIDRARVEDAFNEVRKRQIDLSIGQEDGFQNLRSGDAVKRPVLKEWSEKFDVSVNEIVGGLDNDEQREELKRRVDVSKTQFSQDILQHLARENKTYQGQVMDATVETERNAASIHWNSPSDAMASVERVRAAVDTYAEANGLDDEVKEVEYIKRASAVHASVIEQSLNSNNPEYAELWFKMNRKEIDADTASQIEKAIGVSGVRVKAQRATDEIMSMGLSENKAKAEARKKYSGKEQDEVVQRISQRYAEIDEAKNKYEAQAADQAWKLVVARKSLDSIPPTLWSRMAGSDQRQISDYVRAASQRDRKEDDWAMLDQVEEEISQGDITDTSQLIRYEPFFKESTFRTLRKKVDQRGKVSPSIMQKAFEDRIGKTRTKWKDKDRKQWIEFQRYIADNVKETKRPEDVDVWADKWFMEGYGREDRLLSIDPGTYGEAVAAGRKDFLIETPDEPQVEIREAMSLLEKAGAEVPRGRAAMDEFYTKYYADAQRWFSARDLSFTPERLAAYSLLNSQGKPITEANIDYVAGQMR